MVFWRWWIFTGLLAFSGGYCLYENLHQWLWNNDVTKLSFVILISFIFISLYCGQLSYLKYKKPNKKLNLEPVWFASEACITVGMIGTVAGFLLMLGTAFLNINVEETETLQRAIGQLAVGMSTALTTTLLGLICSLLIKFQLINIENSGPTKKTSGAYSKK
tara:strand:+ start:846 stop:1331 length:486 start_codon:yes stop_codon:yes gene_type:complete